MTASLRNCHRHIQSVFQRLLNFWIPCPHSWPGGLGALGALGPWRPGALGALGANSRVDDIIMVQVTTEGARR